MQEHRDYRQFLREEFRRRSQASHSYSLRAFARDLSLQPSQLSDVLSGKKSLSLQKAERLVERMGLTGVKRKLFITSLTALSARSRSVRERAAQELKEISVPQASENMTAERIKRYVRHWYYPTLLELTKTKSFQTSFGWIASRLGIPKAWVEEAVSALLELGLLKRSGQRLRATEKDIIFEKDDINLEIQNLHREILKKAEAALTLQAPSERDFSNVIIPISPKQIPEFKKVISEFRNKVNALSYVGDTRSEEVYTISVQMFKLTQGGHDDH